MTVFCRKLALIIPVLLFAPTALFAQGIRGELRVRGDAVGFQSLQRDSVPESQVSGSGSQRQLADGTAVTCVSGDF